MRSRFRRVIAGVDWAWFAPGGGVEADETVQDAAVREVKEETGIDIGGHRLTHLAFSEGNGKVGDVVGPMRDDIFTTVTSSSLVSVVGMEPHELEGLDRFRWWSLSELRGTSEVVFPRRLAATLDRFTTAGSWPEPAQLPW